MKHIIQGRNVLLGLTGGIACYKVCDLASRLTQLGASVRTILTENAARFVGPATLRALTGNPVYTATFGEVEPGGLDHVQLAGFAEILVIAPATANILAKMAHGLADDLLSTTCLSCQAPIVVVPAMETHMWEHPATRDNMALLKKRGVRILEPESGRLASGASGTGRLPERETIIELIARVLGERQDLHGRTVLVTAGPTREYLDPVRFISNPSSGRMGFALARAAVRLGAREVHLVTGPVSLATPLDVVRRDVTGADQMLAAVRKLAARADLVVAAAAVGDWAPVKTAGRKIKKTGRGGRLALELRETPDVLEYLSKKRKKGAVVAGFAVETEAEVSGARAKLEKKGLDLVVLNNPLEKGAGFGGDTNRVTLIEAGGGKVDLPLMSKDELAERILEKAAQLLGSQGRTRRNER